MVPQQRYGTLRIGPAQFDLSRRTVVMGVLNVTPDSFSDGGRYTTVEAAVAHALRMVDEGADIIDIGGESTRPSTVYGGSTAVSADEECARVLPVIRALVERQDIVISIDTTKSAVAREALASGANMVNDISGLAFDPAIAAETAERDAVLVLMHIRGTPATMQVAPSYVDVIGEVKRELQVSVDRAKAAGVHHIIIDPGIGFGKDLGHNLSIMKHLAEFRSLGYPILVGTSRKGFIGTLLAAPVEDRMEGTAATVAAAIMQGANIVRVHDVKAMKRVAVVTDAILNAG